MQDIMLQNAYQYCQQAVRNHYENFPVASWFLPKRVRLPITVIYVFARTADDFADEDDIPDEERLDKLREYEHKLEHLNKHTDDPLFLALGNIIAEHHLSLPLFHDLLTAFSMDVTKKRYTSFSSVLFYCKHSANPIGRLLLELYNETSQQALDCSDAICTALQLINFYQDLAQDFDENNRIYIPSDEMAEYDVTVDHFRDKISDSNMIQLMEFQINRARQMLLSGYKLGKILPGRMGYEMRLVIEAGLAICKKLMKHNNNIFARPRLSRLDGISIALRAAFYHSDKNQQPRP